MELAAPMGLAAGLAVLALMGLLWWTGRPRLAVVRGVLGALLVLALADPKLAGPTEAGRVVHVIDASASIPEAQVQAAWAAVRAEVAERAPETRTGLVQVDGTARILSALAAPDHLPVDLLPPTARTGTDLAEGLTLAGQLLGHDAPGTVVVHTDGQVAPDAIEPILTSLSARGISVSVRAIESEHPEADLLALTLPDRADVGATVDATVDVWGGQAGVSSDATVQLRSPEGTVQPLDPLPVAVAPGTRASVPLPIPIPPTLDAGLWTVEVSLPAGPPLVRGLHIDTPPTVVLVRGNPRDANVLQGVFEAEGFQVTAAPSSAPPPLDATVDLVVLAGTPTRGPGALPAPWIRALSEHVEGGGGLLTLAGPGGYAGGGWQDSALADILPVRIDPDGAEKDDSASLLVVLDKSGSMARPAEDARNVEGMIAGVADMMVGGRADGSKIRVAAEAAAATMTKLRDHDRVGVLAVDTLPYWSVKMTSAENRQKAMAKTRRISAGGGGMYVLTALEAASVAMLAEETPLRHILMLVDASDAGEQTRDVFGNTRGALTLAKELGEAGITISVVGIGRNESRDSPFLRKLTRAGGGRLELTPDIRKVSALFAQEVERLVGSAEHEQAPVSLVVEGWHPALQGIDIAGAPRIHGWSDVLPRPRARTILTTPAGTPIFAVWNRGLGQVAAWTTDDGARWARGWPAWSGSAPFWVQLGRDLARTAGGREDALTIDTRTDTVHIRARSMDEDGEPLATGRVQVEVQVDGQPVSVPPPVLVAPGTVETHLIAPTGSRITARATVQQDDGPSTPLGEAAAIVPSPGERAHIGTRAAVLTQLDRPAASAPVPPSNRRSLWPWLVVFAAALLPVDAWARRSRTPRSR